MNAEGWGLEDAEAFCTKYGLIIKVKEVETDKWFALNKWSKDNPGELTPKEQAFIGQVAFSSKRGRALTYKQSKWALDIYEKAVDAGWNEK